MTRRGLLKWLGGLALAGATVGTYALAIEPGFLLRTQYYALTPPNWTPGLKLRLVLIADPHLGEPYMSLGRWNRILDLANFLEGDLILLLGDFTATHRFVTSRIPIADTAHTAKKLTSRLGTYAIIGNHDWWGDATAQSLGHGPTLAERAMEDAGIPVLENRVARLAKDNLPFWLSG
ncbi:MAG: metallophosphoesterase, partial [Hyphomicrobiales bacterium]|nr:metallophosphoesterase [Hyphomicrobiales bacterium]